MTKGNVLRVLVIVFAPFIFRPCANVPYSSQPLAIPLCHYFLFWQSSLVLYCLYGVCTMATGLLCHYVYRAQYVRGERFFHLLTCCTRYATDICYYGSFAYSLACCVMEGE